MQKTLLLKAGLLALILLVLKLLLMAIGGVVGERNQRQQEVVREIASSQYGPQILTGLILSIPYVEEFDETVSIEGRRKTEKRRIERTLRFYPSRNEIRGEATIGTKSRGLFKARVFDWNGSVTGEFALDIANFPRANAHSQITWGQAILSFPLNDPRGLVGMPSIQWNGEIRGFERGSGLPNISSGIHTRLERFDPTRPQRHAYVLKIGLRGSESLSFVPIADSNHISLASPWPHPSFGGQFLPDPQTQQVSKDGFAAEWQISALASKAQQQISAQFERAAGCPGTLCADQVSVRFIEPIDIYALSDRSIKYGLLFILLTFGCFVLFEILKRLPIHPAQYLLVGLAMAVFFLLLIALSEHVAFAAAYLASSVACIALLGGYLSAVLRSRRRGLAFGMMLTLLYGALYGLLVSEDNALLLGSLLLFGMIALAMIATRKVDWYVLDAVKN
jgi:inner membrane protein